MFIPLSTFQALTELSVLRQYVKRLTVKKKEETGDVVLGETVKKIYISCKKVRLVIKSKVKL